MMKNENIISLINSMNMDVDLKYLKDDVAVSLLKHSFDASAIDIYSSLLNGGTLVLIPKEDEFNAKKVVETIRKNNVTRLFTVHKWIEQIQNVCIENNIKLDKLRIIGTGAEVLNPKKFEKLLLNNPNLSIYNTYGPTEATMFMTKHKVTVEDIQKDYSTIGKLMPTTRAIILDKDNKVLPINIQGELGIYQEENSAKNIAKGYLNQDKLSKEKFITLYNEISGSKCKCYKTGDIVKLNRNLELEFIGRKDDFVKVAGGYLVSLNEVEQRIKELLGENIEVSVMTSKIKNSNVLILFICKNEKSLNIKTDDIKNIIDENITFYMKPRHIIELDKIPRNKNGKIDRKELDQIANKYLKTRNKIISPQTTLEQIIYDKVKKIVKEDFSITDDFEDDLGLDSSNMTSLYISLGNDKMTIQDLYNYSTVKDLANMMNTEIVNKRENRKENIEVRFIIDNISTFDTDSELRLTIMAGLAQDESRRISERVQFGVIQSMKKGVAFGNYVYGYDFVRDEITGKKTKLVINEEEAKVIRYIFNAYLYEGKGAYTIAKELKVMGILIKRPRSKQQSTDWRNGTILDILRNVKYVGDLKQRITYTTNYLEHTKKFNEGEVEFIYTKNHHPAIIDRETFNKTQKELKRRSEMYRQEKNKYSNKHTFSGKLVCGICGKSYVGGVSRERKEKMELKENLGDVIQLLIMEKKHIENGQEIGCDNERVNDYTLKECFKIALRDILDRKKDIKNEVEVIIRKTLEKCNDEIETGDNLIRQREKLNRERNRLLDLCLKEIIDDEIFKEKNIEIENKISKIDKELQAQKNKQMLRDNIEDILCEVRKIIDNILNIKEFSKNVCKELVDKVVICNKNKFDFYLKGYTDPFNFNYEGNILYSQH